MALLAGVFKDGKRFENYLTELDMIEVDTEHPMGCVPDVDESTLNTLHYLLKLSNLSPAHLLLAEGPYSVLYKAFELANRKGECLFYMILADD